MGIALSAFNSLLTPLCSLFGWLPPTRAHATAPAAASCRARALPSSCPTLPARSQLVKGNRGDCARVARPTRPLRVVRLLDKDPSAAAGRMVISGRMADVCAELDRLAAAEARAALRH